MKKNKKKINGGFTLIELAVSSAILATIFGAMTIFGVQTLRSFQRSQALKNSIENASYAIEILNRSIRTSHTVSGESDRIFIIDNEAKNSYCYLFEDKKLKRKVGAIEDESCADISSSFSEVIGGADIEVSGKFDIKETDLGNDERGFIRTVIGLKYLASSRDNFDDDEVLIQSSVSLRDYGFELMP